MSTDAQDERVERALVATARAVPADLDDLDIDAVMDSVRRRRTRRRRAAMRRRAVAVAAASVVVVAAGAAWWRADPPARIDTAAGSTTESTSTSAPVSGDTGETTPASADVLVKGQIGPALDVPGTGETVSVLGSDGDEFWIGRADPADDDEPAVSTITGVRLDGTIGPTTEVHGIPLLATVASERLWVVTEDRIVTTSDPARFRLKEIDLSESAVRSSTALGADRPVALRATDDGPVILTLDHEVAVDPSTRRLSERPRPIGDRSDAPRLVVDGSSWSLEGDTTSTEVVHRDLATGTVSEPLPLVGSSPPVGAAAWGEGAAAAIVRVGDRSDLIELLPPPSSSRTGPPSSRTLVTGLPTEIELVAVGADRAWLLVGERLAAIPIG